MSKCDVDIHIPKSGYTGGERLTGEVVLTADSDFEAREVTIELDQRVHGRGNRQLESVVSHTLWSGSVSRGETRFSFSIELPNGPETYHGHYLNVDWELKANVDVAWARDPHSERDIVLKSHSDLPYPTHDLGTTRASAALGTFGLAMFCSVFLMFGIGAIWIGLTQGIFMIVFGSAFMMIAALMIVKVAGQIFAVRKLGPVAVVVEPSDIRAGKDVNVCVSFAPRSEANIRSISARLRSYERVVSGSGTNRSTHTHKLTDQEFPLLGVERTVHPGQPLEARARISIPETASPSFLTTDNQLAWEVDLAIDIDGWPDWGEIRAITVRPA